jgi:integrase
VDWLGKGRSNYRFIVRGKTGERDVIFRSAAARRVDKILAKRDRESSNNFLFSMPDGSKVITLIDQFNAALKQAFALFMLKTGL